ncbi:TetR-like C-terminal domain-containing protein [Nonomuraea jabiensis]|uniref:TetR-like C-terminal domain-containing protein n=1 Tax=Nonomuraea jabiensis TaxID=882448 RepID=UPI003D72B031
MTSVVGQRSTSVWRSRDQGLGPVADLGGGVDAAAAGADLATLAHTLRAWALEDPQRYLLIYGTPVPGYHPLAQRQAGTVHTARRSRLTVL